MNLNKIDDLAHKLAEKNAILCIQSIIVINVDSNGNPFPLNSKLWSSNPPVLGSRSFWKVDDWNGFEDYFDYLDSMGKIHCFGENLYQFSNLREDLDL